MFRFPKILLLLACIAGITLLFQKNNPKPRHQKSFANYPVAISLKGVSIDDIEYDSCLRALTCLKQNDFKNFEKFYAHNNQVFLSNDLSKMRFKECANWFYYENISVDKKIVRIDSAYGYTDDNGSIITNPGTNEDKERITYVTFLFPSNQTPSHSAKLLTFEFSDKISTDHFINWWSETI